MDHSSEIGGFGLDRGLLDRTRASLLTGTFWPRFECPDCVGEAACPTCGEPTRPAVYDHLARALVARLAS